MGDGCWGKEEGRFWSGLLSVHSGIQTGSEGRESKGGKEEYVPRSEW